MLRGAVTAVAVAASACAYQPGSFIYGPSLFFGEKATIGCLDIAIERRDDHDKSAVLSYRFGNRCDHAQIVDFANARVIGRDEAGGEHVMRPFDPRGEIKAMPLDARLVGKEAIAYVAADEIGADLVQVCVDAASIVRSPKEHWMCFARKAEPVEEPPPDEGLSPTEQAETVALVHEGDE
jgi:hypothetical protein